VEAQYDIRATGKDPMFWAPPVSVPFSWWIVAGCIINSSSLKKRYDEMSKYCSKHQ
jgi:hypothetical protein